MEDRNIQDKYVFKIQFESPSIRKPITIDLEGSLKQQLPGYQWNVTSMLNENLTLSLDVHGHYEFGDDGMTHFKINSLASKSVEAVRKTKKSDEMTR